MVFDRNLEPTFHPPPIFFSWRASLTHTPLQSINGTKANEDTRFMTPVGIDIFYAFFTFHSARS